MIDLTDTERLPDNTRKSEKVPNNNIFQIRIKSFMENKKSAEK